MVRARTSRQLLDLREREVVPLAAAARGVEVDEARVVLAVLVGRLVLRIVRRRWLSEHESPTVAAPGGLWVDVRGGVAPAASSTSTSRPKRSRLALSTCTRWATTYMLRHLSRKVNHELAKADTPSEELEQLWFAMHYEQRHHLVLLPSLLAPAAPCQSEPMSAET